MPCRLKPILVDSFSKISNCRNGSAQCFEGNMTGLTLVAGAGGFIGGQLIRDLVESGVAVRAADCKPLDRWFFRSDGSQNLSLDLREIGACREATKGVEQVYNLAADMGGMGFIECNKALCMLSVLINTNLLIASRDHGVSRFFFA